LRSSNKDIELLESYLQKRLSAKEIDLIESRLQAEPNLSADLEELRIFKAATRANVLKEKMNMLKNIEKTNTSKFSLSWWKWLSIIFVLGFLGYLFYFFTLRETNQIAPKYKGIYATRFDDELILHKTMRSAVQPVPLTGEQRRAYELYSIQLFDEAAPLLETLWTEKKDTLALFYLGISEIGQGNEEKGLKILKKPELTKYKNQINIFINH
jgi:hypothetical protein